jgi:hypothetical protein
MILQYIKGVAKTVDHLLSVYHPSTEKEKKRKRAAREVMHSAAQDPFLSPLSTDCMARRGAQWDWQTLSVANVPALPSRTRQLVGTQKNGVVFTNRAFSKVQGRNLKERLWFGKQR